MLIFKRWGIRRKHSSSTWQDTFDGFPQPLQSNQNIVAQINPQRSTTVRLQRLEIAERLRILEHTKTVRRFRDRKVNFVLRGNLDEDSGILPAFVKLPGVMQEPWTITTHRGATRRVANQLANGLQLRFSFRSLFNVGQQRHVIRIGYLLEVSTEDFTN